MSVVNPIMWRLVAVDTVEGGDANDTGVFHLEGDGRKFTVSITAPKRATGEEFLGALRAAVSFYYLSLHDELPPGSKAVKMNG